MPIHPRAHNAPRVLDATALELIHTLVREFVGGRRPAARPRSPSPTTSRAAPAPAHLPRACPRTGATSTRATTCATSSSKTSNRYVREHLSQAVTISDIAGELGYSVSHLRAVFRDRLGVSLGRYMRESRLSEAAQLLQRSEFNVSEIGERCGFESLYAFSEPSASLRHPPRTYRQLVSEGGQFARFRPKRLGSVPHFAGLPRVLRFRVLNLEEVATLDHRHACVDRLSKATPLRGTKTSHSPCGL